MTATDALDVIANNLRWMPDWLFSLLLFIAVGAIGLLIHAFAFRLLTRAVDGADIVWRSLVTRAYRPSRIGAVILVVLIVAPAAPLSAGAQSALRHSVAVCIAALLAWIVHQSLDIWTTIYLRRLQRGAATNLLVRKQVTQARILQRVATTIITVMAVAVCLMTFDSVRQYGVSLLASAGAAGLVAGLALQPLLKNLFAGIQLAITQPISIDDALLIEGEWGTVEEITSTYVVLRLWDWRRLILPLSYFLEHPFQNWTRDDASLIGNVMLYLDYSAPIDAIRAKVEEIAKASSRWDKQVVNVQVTDFKDSTLELRILISASDAGSTFDLRCEMREKLIAFIKTEYPGALPRRRVETPDWSLAEAPQSRSFNRNALAQSA
jgi:small-conductance mechanosensitive channel